MKRSRVKPALEGERQDFPSFKTGSCGKVQFWDQETAPGTALKGALR
jgi:hypothetical protein